MEMLRIFLCILHNYKIYFIFLVNSCLDIIHVVNSFYDGKKELDEERSNWMKQFMKIYKDLLMLSQLSLSFITPILLCLALSWWLSSYVGLWVYIPGFLLGLGSAFMVAYKFYLSVTKKEEREKDSKKKKASYNKHL